MASRTGRLILLPWPQITHLDLTLGFGKHQDDIDIVSRCLNLVSLAYRSRMKVGNNNMEHTSSVYIFPHLTSLAVHDSPAILPRMRCPALQTLEITGYLGASSIIQTAWADFRVFLDKSQCTLQELHLIPIDGASDSKTFSTSLLEFLTSVSHVPRLKIDLSYIISSSATGLINREHKLILFPELQVLTLKARASEFHDSDIPSRYTFQHHVEYELMRIIESLWRVPEGAARIRKTNIELYSTIKHHCYDDFEDPEVKARHKWLKAAMMRGLDVSVVFRVCWSYNNMVVKESIMTCL
ncbi:hypothetical protein CPB85DRAFT_1315665 [Mucidula mucida]|nr:hypothetical protein CPB85DRAFT_1315665 [Mucidula mucida]